MPVMKTPVYRSENGTFYSQCFYRDGRGAKRHKVKRGFATEHEALMWEKDFLAVHNGTMDMLFADFVDVYATEIKPIDVVRWQNQLIDHKDANGKPCSATYLRTINNRLNAIFNHVERYYDLTSDAAKRSGPKATRSPCHADEHHEDGIEVERCLQSEPSR